MSDQDFFVEKEEEKPVQEKVDKKKNEQPPNNYLPIKLSSLGKLSAPKKIHVRNYTGSDARELSLSDEDNILETLLRILRGMIWEDVNPEDLHEKELEEIMMNIYVNFWSSSFVDYPYPYKQEELESLSTEKRKRIENKDEIPRITIPFSLINTETINEEFKEPINPKIKKKNNLIGSNTVSFILPRVGHVINAKVITQDKFSDQEEKFASLKRDIEYNSEVDEKNSNAPRRKVDNQQYDEYVKYLKNRVAYFNLLTQCQMLHSFNGKKLTTIDDQLEAYQQVDLLYWSVFNDIIDKYAKFGVQESIEVTSPLTGEKVLRRFQFRLLDYIPTLDQEDVSDYDVVFGE